MLPKMFKSQNSLTRTIIIKMGIRIAIIIIAVTLVSYWHITSNLELQVVEQLDKYITERGQRESTLFQLVEENQRVFQKEFIFRYQNMDDEVPLTRFNQLFEKREDGTTRLYPKYFEGIQQANGGITQNMSGFIGQNVKITADLRRILVISYDMLNMYGPAWNHIAPNIYFNTPKNTDIAYWPGEAWDLEAPADMDITQEEWFYMSDVAHNPQRETVWTGLYYDKIAKKWMVSCVTPIDIEGRQIASIGTDIFLDDLFKRTLNVHLEGTYNIIFREDGRIIAHPNKIKELQKKEGLFEILRSGDQHLIRIFKLVKESKKVVIENHQNHEYLAVTKIDGPDWYLVTVYPKSLLADLAFDTARFILLLGIISLFIEVTILLLVLLRQVAHPLQDFLGATQQIAAGNFNAEATQNLPLNRRDEIGELAQSFNSMAGQLKTSFDTLDGKVIEKTAQLNDKIEELTQTRQEMIHSEKMAALGQLVAGIAHEVNTPLGAIRSSAESLSSGLKQTLEQLPKLFQVLTPEQQEKFFALLEDSLQSKVTLTVKEKRAAKKTITAELKKSGIEKSRVFTDTFISLGIYEHADQYLSLLKHPHSDLIFDAAYQLSTLTRSTRNIKTAVERASKVIFALKTFARFDQSGEKIASNLQYGLETVLTLYYNQIKHGVDLIKEYEEIPAIQCYPDELNQVWTNIVHNALQAMENKGTLKVNAIKLSPQIRPARYPKPGRSL